MIMLESTVRTYGHGGHYVGMSLQLKCIDPRNDKTTYCVCWQ